MTSTPRDIRKSMTVQDKSITDKFEYRQVHGSIVIVRRCVDITNKPIVQIELETFRPPVNRGQVKGV